MTVFSASQIVKVTEPVKFTATVNDVGKENFSYQWRHNGEDIYGETSNTLTMYSVTKDDGGTYECVIMNEYGDCVISNIIELSKSLYSIFKILL